MRAWHSCQTFLMSPDHAKSWPAVYLGDHPFWFVFLLYHTIIWAGDGYEDDAQYEVGILRKTAVADMPVKEIITLGTFSYSGGGSDSQKAIVNFNRKSDKYRVEVIPYMVEE